MTVLLRRLAGQRQSIVLAAALLVVGGIGSRLLGLVRDITIANVFGPSLELDAYYAAFRIPDVMFQLVTGAVITSAFIPTFTGLLTRNQREEAQTLANTIITISLLATIAMSLIAFAATPAIVAPLTGFSADRQVLTEPLVRIMLLSPAFFSVSALFTAILNGHRHFFLPAIAPWGYNLSIISGALLLGPVLGVTGLAVGVVAGSMLHLAVQFPGIVRSGLRLAPALALQLASVREVGRLMLPRVFGLVAIHINWFVITGLGGTLPPGQLSALNIAWPLMMLPLGLFGVSIAMAAFPTLAAQRGEGDLEAFSRTTERTLRTILFLVVPASIGLAVLAPYLVGTLYQRGRFDAGDTLLTAHALTFLALGLVGHGVVEILTRVFYAARNTITPVLLVIVGSAINIVLAFLLAPVMGHGGLALSLSVAALVEGVLLVWLVRTRLGVRFGATGRRGIGVTAAAGVAMLGALVAFRLLAPPRVEDPFFMAGQLIAGAAIATIAFGGVAALFRADELEWVVGRIASRLPGRPASSAD